MDQEAATAVLGRFVANMPADMRDALAAAGTLVRYPDGATIQQRGDIKPGLSIVVEGRVVMSATDAAGEAMTYVTMGPGDNFGEMTLFLDIPRTLDATAKGDTAINQISRDAFTHLLDDQPALRDHLLASLARQLSLALERVDDMRRLPATVRVAKALMLAAEPGEAGHVAHGSQTSFAETIAATRVTAGKALGELAAAGLIETAYRRVIIPDLDRLSAWIAVRAPLAPIVEPGV